MQTPLYFSEDVVFDNVPIHFLIPAAPQSQSYPPLTGMFACCDDAVTCLVFTPWCRGLRFAELSQSITHLACKLAGATQSEQLSEMQWDDSMSNATRMYIRSSLFYTGIQQISHFYPVVGGSFSGHWHLDIYTHLWWLCYNLRISLILSVSLKPTFLGKFPLWKILYQMIQISFILLCANKRVPIFMEGGMCLLPSA